jgi:hypothetical protein
MKHLKLKLIALFIGLTVISAGCSSDNGDCSATAYLPITGVTGPETALVNQEIIFTVSAKVYNDCASLTGLEQDAVYPRNIYAQGLFEGCDTCNATPNNTATTEYKFSAEQPGEYKLVFHSELTNITKTVVVSNPE